MPANFPRCIKSIVIADDGEAIECPEKALIAKDQEAALLNLSQNSLFAPVDDGGGPYDVRLSIEENRLIFRITNAMGVELPILVLSIKPYKRLIKDYYMIMRSYDDAIRDGKPSRIEAIDMVRRGLHNDAGALLMERLGDKIELDLCTARRLFTLICVLHAGKAHILR
jgi:uncharacterized protein (UPF0262 family)